MDTLLQSSDLSRYFGQKCAVNQLQLTLNQGEVLGLLGVNGAGKSTSMRMLTGNLAPSSGHVSLLGKDLVQQPIQAKQHLGYLPERPPLYRDLRVDEFLDHCARLHRVPRQNRSAATRKVKALCGLATAGRKLIRHLSRGYQQRVGIAQAIIHEPAVVILDEPTVGLDPVQIREIRDLIRDLGSRRGVILSSHILSEIQSLCSRVQILHQGKTVYLGDLANQDGEQPYSSIRVGLSAPPDLETLSLLPEVTAVDQLHTRRFRLHVGPQARLDQLTQSMVMAAWGLCEFTPEQRTLEQIFIELTTGEADA